MVVGVCRCSRDIAEVVQVWAIRLDTVIVVGVIIDAAVVVASTVGAGESDDGVMVGFVYENDWRWMPVKMRSNTSVSNRASSTHPLVIASFSLILHP